MSRVLNSCGLFAFFACAHFQPPLHPAIGVPEFQQWSLHALQHPSDNQESREFSLAYYGDQRALRAYFREAVRRCDTPLIDPAGGEWLWWTLETLLAKWGDQQFAAALSHESPRIQSAVADSIDSGFLPLYPKTQKLIQNAPKIDFPLDKA